MIFSLAAVGCRLTGPDGAEPGVAPMPGSVVGTIGWTTAALCTFRAGCGAGLIRFGGGLTGDVTVTAGS
jgi:hypothetical protein